MEKLLPNNVFYNELASEYDQMIAFKKAIENKKRLLKNLITPEMKYAADLGCGSGVDSIALTSLGLKVTAFDPSAEMLEVAKENIIKEKAKVTLHNQFADSISEDFDEQFDLVVSLGNTFANIGSEQLIKSLQRCKQILKPQGILLIQILNYDKILNEKQRIVNITEGEDEYFIRFYDFIGTEIIFNIITFNKEKSSKHKLISTKLFPHTQNDFDAVLKKIDFSKAEYFSDFDLTIFNNEKSKDLIIKVIKE
ncbi:MAG: class I SAM-dependent methyltransferase [Ignavibacteria bacterium]|nr:class I SAM-dependent methyltransferase [Ignavibacteria bacterium]